MFIPKFSEEIIPENYADYTTGDVRYDDVETERKGYKLRASSLSEHGVAFKPQQTYGNDALAKKAFELAQAEFRQLSKDEREGTSVGSIAVEKYAELVAKSTRTAAKKKKQSSQRPR